MIEIKAYAKINLFLDIVGKNEDNYHLLEMFNQKINIYDTLRLEKIDKGIIIKCNNDDVPTDENNLIYKAIRSILDINKHGVSVYLKKNIPSMAGLGGGSSDACSALIGVRELYNLDIENDKLIEISKKIGSDVPFFFSESAAKVCGVGDKIEHKEPIKGVYILIVKPYFGLSTKEVYENFKFEDYKNDIYKLDNLIQGIEDGDYELISNNVYNALGINLYKKYEVFNEIRKILLNSGAMAAEISGSGSSMFGVFKYKERAMKAKRKIKGCYMKIVLPLGD